MNGPKPYRGHPTGVRAGTRLGIFNPGSWGRDRLSRSWGKLPGLGWGKPVTELAAGPGLPGAGHAVTFKGLRDELHYHLAIGSLLPRLSAAPGLLLCPTWGRTCAVALGDTGVGSTSSAVGDFAALLSQQAPKWVTEGVGLSSPGSAPASPGQPRDLGIRRPHSSLLPFRRLC